MEICFDYISYSLAIALAHTSGYFGVTVQGTSMTEAGIRGGDMAILEKYYEWVDGAIMLIIKEQDNKKYSQIHRVRRIGNDWWSCWEDGSGMKTLLDENNYPQGLLVAVAH